MSDTMNQPRQSPQLSVLAPIYNEEENIQPLVEKIVAALDPLGRSFEIVAVDDGSTDRSLEVLAGLQETHPCVVIVKHRTNCGQTAAFDTAFHAARGDIFITIDADLQNDPADIARLLEKIDDGYDAVCGVRVKRDDPWMKLTSSRIANAYRRWVLKDSFTDTGCSLKAFRRECALAIKLFNGLHRFLPMLFEMEGFRVGEVPVAHHPRTRGASKYGTWNRLWCGLADLRSVRWMQKRHLPLERTSGDPRRHSQ